jgi:hypothetical protein
VGRYSAALEKAQHPEEKMQAVLEEKQKALKRTIIASRPRRP